MRVDELVDGRLVGAFDALELQAHARPAVAPGHARLDVELALAAGQAEAKPRPRADLERAGRYAPRCRRD